MFAKGGAESQALVKHGGPRADGRGWGVSIEAKALRNALLFFKRPGDGVSV